MRRFFSCLDRWIRTPSKIGSKRPSDGSFRALGAVLGLLLSAAGSVGAQTGCDTDGSQRLVFEDFSDLAAWTLNGVTAGANPTAGGHLLLTYDLGQSGSAFVSETVVLRDSTGFRASFSAAFRFRITDPQGISDQDGQGADGIVFVVQTVANDVGGTGGGIGYQGIDRSLGVELDSWNNGSQDQGSGNHLGVNLDGSVTSTGLLPVAGRFNDGQPWYVWVDYDGATQLLEVRLAQTDQRPPSAQLSTTVDLPQVLEQDSAFIGFTSGTGGAGGDHQIERFEFVNRYAPIDVCHSVDFNSQPPTEVVANGTFSYLAVAEDSTPGATLTYLVESAPAGLAIDPASGQVTWTTQVSDIGLHPVTLRATSSSGLSNTQSFTIEVLPPLNTAPRALPQSPNVVEDGVLAITLAGEDDENDPLTFLLGTGPEHGTLSGVAPDLTYTPAADFFGSDSFTFSVSDGVLVSTEATVSIEVSPVNDPPRITSVAPTLAMADHELSYDVLATDVDSDPLTYEPLEGPTNLTLDLASGQLRWQPRHSDAGSHAVRLAVHDGVGGSDEQAFDLMVIENDGSAGSFGTDFWVMVSYNPVEASFGELLIVSDQATQGRVELANVRSVVDFEVRRSGAVRPAGPSSPATCR